MFNRRDQESNVSVDAYVTALRKLAKTCNYGSLTDSLIRDRMVVGINDNFAVHFAVHRCVHRRRQTRRATPLGDRQECPASPTTYAESPHCPQRASKHELDRSSNIGVIRKVDTHTSWISALVVTTKKNGKVRLCIDPKPLNEVLHRNHYPLPKIDGVLPLLSKARVFTVLDAKKWVLAHAAG